LTYELGYTNIYESDGSLKNVKIGCHRFFCATPSSRQGALQHIGGPRTRPQDESQPTAGGGAPRFDRRYWRFWAFWSSFSFFLSPFLPARILCVSRLQTAILAVLGFLGVLELIFIFFHRCWLLMKSRLAARSGDLAGTKHEPPVVPLIRGIYKGVCHPR
jgi:hypothetical protein